MATANRAEIARPEALKTFLDETPVFADRPDADDAVANTSTVTFSQNCSTLTSTVFCHAVMQV